MAMSFFSKFTTLVELVVIRCLTVLISFRMGTNKLQISGLASDGT